jgi:hypothetical protein
MWCLIRSGSIKGHPICLFPDHMPHFKLIMTKMKGKSQEDLLTYIGILSTQQSLHDPNTFGHDNSFSVCTGE